MALPATTPAQPQTPPGQAPAPAVAQVPQGAPPPAPVVPTQSTSALQAMSNNIPVANAKLASQQNAARTMQLQQAVGAAKPAQATAQTAQTLGTQMAAQAGQQQVASVANQAGQQGQVAQIGQQVQQLKDTQAVNDAKMGLNQQQETNLEQFAAISAQAKQTMYDAKMQFTQTQQGEQFNNERQLADYAKIRAQTDQQWQNYVTTTNDLQQKQTQVLNEAYNKVSQQMQIQNSQAIQLRQQADQLANAGKSNAAQLSNYQQALTQAETLRAASVALQKSIAANQAKQAGTLAKNQAIGTIGGAIIGGIAGSVVPGAGTAVGASMGASLGGGIATYAAGSAQRG